MLPAAEEGFNGERPGCYGFRNSSRAEIEFRRRTASAPFRKRSAKRSLGSTPQKMWVMLRACSELLTWRLSAPKVLNKSAQGKRVSRAQPWVTPPNGVRPNGAKQVCCRAPLGQVSVWGFAPGRWSLRSLALG